MAAVDVSSSHALRDWLTGSQPPLGWDDGRWRGCSGRKSRGLITTKRLLRRPKDLHQLPALEELRDQPEGQAGAPLPEAGREPPGLGL